MFTDEAGITIAAGKGGNGCLSFRREKYIEKGGPDGGDGGDGGSIYLRANAHINTLNYFKYNRNFSAESGSTGQGNQRTGKSGDDLYIDVPLGTVAKCRETTEFIGELLVDEQTLLLAVGGIHGLGNTRFKSSINRAPRKTTKGTLGENKTIDLELQILADVGLIGMPNAGKSSLITTLSNSKSKVADYPFTTIEPSLGVVEIDSFRSIVMADLPGLVHNAHQGTGMGFRFLRHVSRNHLLMQVVDCSLEPQTVVNNIQVIRHELEQYNAELLQREQILVFNKIDLLEHPDQHIAQIVDVLDNTQINYCLVSAKEGLGMELLLHKIREQFEERDE